MFLDRYFYFLLLPEQLGRVEGGIDNMNAEMKEAEKHLTGMEKWCGLCICPWNRRPKVRDVDGTWQSNNKVLTTSLNILDAIGIKNYLRILSVIFKCYYRSINLKSGGAVKGQPASKGTGGNVPDGAGANQQYVRRINNDAREDEMEENMQAVGGILGNLKNMATDMGSEIEKQNQQLDRINDKVIILFFVAKYHYAELQFQMMIRSVLITCLEYVGISWTACVCI